MANEDDIIQRIALLGSAEIRKELNALGADGEAALQRIEKAGGGDLAKGVRALMPEVAKFDAGLQSAAASAGKLPGILGKIQAAVRGLSGRSGLNNLAQDADAAAAAGKGLGNSMRSVGKDIRALGRVTQLADISGFGRSLALAGRNAGLIAFPAVIAGIERLSNSAATAASNFADLAAASLQTPKAFGAVASVVIALGGTFEDAGKVIGNFEKNIATGVDATKQAADNIASARDNLEGARDSFVDTARGMNAIAVESHAVALAAASGKIGLEQYNEAQQRLGVQAANVRAQIARAGEAIDKAQKQVDKATRATTPLEDAFRKVGVTLSEAFQKLPVDQQLNRIAAGFKNLGPEVDKTKLAVQLLGEEMGRKFVKALSDGEAGLAKFRAEGERIRPTFTTAQIAIGDDLVKASSNLVASLASLKDAFGLVTAPIFTSFFKTLTDIIVSIRPAITQLGQAFGTVLKPFLDGVIVVVQLVIAGISALMPLFNGLASLINKAFGTNLTGVQLFAIAIIALIAAIAPMIPLVLLAVAAVGKLVEQLKLVDFAAFLKPATDMWTALQKLFNDGAIAISNAFNTSIEFVKGLWNSLISTIGGWASSSIGFVQSVIDKVKELGRWLASLAGAGSGTGEATTGAAGFATGGEVRGPGTARSDSIWARLSNGEFVIQAAAVRKYGVQFLSALNAMSLSRRSFPGFNMGGLVDALAPMRAVPAYASGGSVRGGPESVLNLTIGTEAFFGLRAPEDTAAKLTKFARRKGVRAAGRKPSWYGGGG
jgi:hypothetical protein